jgi:hypothetical protein
MAGAPLELAVGPDAGFHVELLDSPPGRVDVRTFAGERSGLASPGEALELHVAPDGAEDWVGRFAGGYPSPAALTVVCEGPRPGQLVVVNRGAGYLVPVDDPDAAVELDLGPIVGLLVSRDPALVLVADFTTLAAFTPEGRRWSAEVSWDGVRLGEVEGPVVRGQGWDAPSGRDVAFEVELATGRVLRGVTPRPR